MRLNRFLAASGLGSRRACEALIREGKISINGHFIRDLATVVNPGDEVRVAGKPPLRPVVPVYILLLKPKGVVCTRSDERGRRRPSLTSFQHILAGSSTLDDSTRKAKVSSSLPTTVHFPIV